MKWIEIPTTRIGRDSAPVTLRRDRKAKKSRVRYGRIEFAWYLCPRINIISVSFCSELDEEECMRRRQACINQMSELEKQITGLRDQYVVMFCVKIAS